MCFMVGVYFVLQFYWNGFGLNCCVVCLLCGVCLCLMVIAPATFV